MPQLETGFITYDKEIGGFFKDELIVSSGKAGDGKSALALSIANYVGLVKYLPVHMFCSGNVSTHATICRLVTQITGVPYKRVYRGALSEEEWKIYDSVMDRISRSKITFNDSRGRSCQRDTGTRLTRL